MKTSVATLLLTLGMAAAAPQGGYQNILPPAAALQTLQTPSQFGGDAYQFQPAQYDFQPAQYDFQPAQYDFQYNINDQYSGNFLGHAETRDGTFTQGSYYVQLPDSRVMKVDYYADEYGYHPTITYEGEAQYPVSGADIYAQEGLSLAPARAPTTLGDSLPGFVPSAPLPLRFPQQNLGLAPVPSRVFSLPAPQQRVLPTPQSSVLTPAQLVFQESSSVGPRQVYPGPSK